MKKQAVNTLQWWSAKTEYGALHDVARMLFGIPASYAEDGRAFSSADSILSQRRGRLELHTFQEEYRVWSYLASATSLHTQSGRSQRMERAHKLFKQLDQARE